MITEWHGYNVHFDNDNAKSRERPYVSLVMPEYKHWSLQLQ